MKRSAGLCLLLICGALSRADAQRTAGTSVFVKRYAAHYNVPPELIAAFIDVEHGGTRARSQIKARWG